MSRTVESSIEAILAKKAKVILVAKDSGSKQAWGQALSDLGFKNVVKVSDLKAGVAYLESEEFHWLITTPQMDQPSNLFHLLALCNHWPQLQHLAISVIASTNDNEWLPSAFEWGAVNLFKATDVAPEAMLQISEAMEVMAEVDKDGTLVAYQSLAQHLRTVRDSSSHVGLTASLVRHYPGDKRVLLWNAEALLECGSKKDGGHALNQIRLLYPEAENKIGQLVNQYLDSRLPKPDNIQLGQSPLGIKNCIVCVNDQAISDVMKKQLELLGVETLIASGPRDAEKMIEGHHNLLIISWEMKDIPGPMLVQRLRGRELVDLLIIVVGKGFDYADEALFKEMGVSATIDDEAFDERLFLQTLVHTMQSDRSGYDAEALESKILGLLEAGRDQEAKALFDSSKRQNQIDAGGSLVIHGYFAMKEGEFEVAREFGMKALNRPGRTVAALTLMGKALVKNGDFNLAFGCFDAAQDLSPLNINRLCQMAEAKGEQGDYASSRELLGEAQQLDGGSERVLETEAKIELVNNDSSPESIQETLKKLGSIRDVIGYMNNKAVQYTLKGEPQRGLALYEKAYQSVSENHKAFRTTINYNLGLAHLRQGNDKLALEVLSRCSASENEAIALKAKNLVDLVRRTLAQNKKLQFKEPTRGGSESLGSEISTKVSYLTQDSQTSLMPGDRALYLIFARSEASDMVRNSLKDLAHFRPKESAQIGGKLIWT